MPADGRLTRRRAALVLAAVLLLAAGGVWLAVREANPKGTVHAPVSPPVPPEVARLRDLGAGLRAVRPGMPRTEVEGLLGRADPPDIGPAEKADGRTVYRVRYRAILTDPSPSAPAVVGYCEAELVFDADQSGHPLVAVTFTPKPPPPGVAAAA